MRIEGDCHLVQSRMKPSSIPKTEAFAVAPIARHSLVRLPAGQSHIATALGRPTSALRCFRKETLEIGRER